MKRRMLTAAVGISLMAGAALGEPVKITVDASTPCRMSTSGDDIARLQHLTAGVGWEFSPNAETTAGLKAVGIERIRCINVDGLPGSFDAQGNFVVTPGEYRIDRHLQTARELGAIPHIIIACHLPESLRFPETETATGERLLGLERNLVTGPNDETLYRNYWIAYFEYVVLTRGAENARFEIFNEPDGGGIVTRRSPKPQPGTRALYEEMFQSYRTIMAAKAEFERRHPGKRLIVGAPGLAWAYTFSFGDFNWINHFIEDCARENLRPDFIGVHYYGNITSLYGEYPSYYPSFEEMFATLSSARDTWLPGVPIEINEWGPSYHVNNRPEAMFNADTLGSVWSLEFLTLLVKLPVDSAMYLVTTDLAQPDADGKLENIWGWCSLFLNPAVYPGAVPKSQYHLFRMIHELAGERILANSVGNVHVLAALDREQRVLRLLVWNFDIVAPEGAPAIDESKEEAVTIQLRNFQDVFGDATVEAMSEELSPDSGDILAVHNRGGEITDAAARVNASELVPVAVQNGGASLNFTLKPGSIRFLTFRLK